jgi:hypothetical protein
MFKRISAFFFRRNNKPSSLLEAIGDWLITPLAYFLLIPSFTTVENNGARFFYETAYDHPYINSVEGFHIARILSFLLLPFALIGVLVKLSALVFSREMRTIYSNWQIPDPIEYKYMVFKSNEDKLKAELYNNLSIMNAAIETGHASLLMADIVKNYHQWLVHLKSDDFRPGFDGFGHADMSFIPYVSECVCCNFNRLQTERRQKMEKEMMDDLTARAFKDQTVTYMSLGAYGFLQELINIYLLLAQGLHVTAFLVDKNFHLADQPERIKGYTDFLKFLQAVAKEKGLKLHIQLLRDLTTFPTETKLDIVSAIDFDRPSIEPSLSILSKAAQQLKPSGRLYLSYDVEDSIYNNEKTCIKSNSPHPLMLTAPKTSAKADVSRSSSVANLDAAASQIGLFAPHSTGTTPFDNGAGVGSIPPPEVPSFRSGRC